MRDDAELFADRSFRNGLVREAKALGDTTDPRKWKVNDGLGPEASDVLIIVAADTEVDVEAEVKRVKEQIEESAARPRLGMTRRE